MCTHYALLLLIVVQEGLPCNVIVQQPPVACSGKYGVMMTAVKHLHFI